MRAINVLFLLILLGSCNYKIEKEKAGAELLPISQELKDSVSYRMVRNEVFGPKCITCHGQAGGVSLESYASASKNLAGIKNSVFNKGSMPKAPISKLNPKQKQVLLAWIEAGGPEKPIGGGDPGPDPDPNPDPGPIEIKPTYASIRKYILDKKCVGCHTPGETAGRFPLVTREDLMNPDFEYVIPENPDDSGIMIVLQPNARKPMPPKDSGITPLTEEEINAIKVWIQEGAN